MTRANGPIDVSPTCESQLIRAEENQAQRMVGQCEGEGARRLGMNDRWNKVEKGRGDGVVEK